MRATRLFMLSASTSLVPLILRTNPAIAMKHWASADSSSPSSPEGWQMSCAERILFTVLRK